MTNEAETPEGSTDEQADIPAPDAQEPDVVPAVALPTMDELDAVAGEIETVEGALARLDKKDAPMCGDCQSAFASASVAERVRLLSCAH